MTTNTLIPQAPRDGDRVSRGQLLRHARPGLAQRRNQRPQHGQHHRRRLRQLGIRGGRAPPRWWRGRRV